MPEREKLRRMGIAAGRVWRFSLRVLLAFVRNRGVLLAGGVGYNVLLSVVPLFAVLAVVLTHVVAEQRLLAVMSVQVSLLAPAHAEMLLEAVRAFLDSRDLIGVIGIVVLLFFSSFAFRMLEDAIAIIFHRTSPPQHGRRLWVSALLPYLFVLMLGVTLLAVTLLMAAVDAIREHGTGPAGLVDFALDRGSGIAVDILGFIGLILLFTAIYKVLPVVRIAWSRALIGGIIAATLWELIRLVIVYYFTSISLVNVIYGSFATIIVILLTLEVGSIILLLGAQVIAELERSAAAGLPWYEEPRDPPVGGMIRRSQ